MYVYVCMYICTFIWTYICTYVCTHVCTNMHGCTYICMYVHTYIHTYICNILDLSYVKLPFLLDLSNNYLYFKKVRLVDVHTHYFNHIISCIHTWNIIHEMMFSINNCWISHIHTCLHKYIHKYMHAYIHTYIYTHTHTHTQTHTYYLCIVPLPD